jgi:hypothetical protein
MRRRTIPFLLVAGMSLLAVASAVLSINTAGHGLSSKKHASHVRVPIGSPQYGFGGYQLYSVDPVTSLSGEWTVPTIAATSSSGDASTWIGAEAQNGAFAQIGTVENRGGGDQYYGFWSDVPQGFHPRRVINVKPGDVVEARMTMESSGWALTLDDLTSKDSRTIHSHYGSSDRFNAPDWLQENPVYSQFVHTNYPTLSTVTFEKMTLNNAIPKFEFQYAETLSTQNDTFFVPTHVKHDQFSLVPASGSALTFLSDVYIEDELSAAFFESATQEIVPGNINTNAYLAGLSFELPILQSQSWPKFVAKAISHYITNQKHLETYVQAWLQESLDERRADLSKVADELIKADGVADRVRSKLGLPPVYVGF